MPSVENREAMVHQSIACSSEVRALGIRQQSAFGIFGYAAGLRGIRQELQKQPRNEFHSRCARLDGRLPLRVYRAGGSESAHEQAGI